MLTLANISKSYGPRTLFEDVTLTIQRADRLGFVGPNGAGKSTLLGIIRGEESADAGTVTWERGSRWGFLPQENAPAGEETILQLALGRVPGVASAAPEDEHHEVDYTLEPRAKRILAGLGFQEADYDRPARGFSGGWVMRAHLARLLVESPTLLLLDEPTNHLDLQALLWLQDHLRRYDGGLVIVSHDRAFLNELCTGIIELRGRRLHRWTGNYDDYLRQREAAREQQAALFKNQQREIAHVQSFVDRFRAKASMASRAQSKLKQVERMKAAAIDEPEDEAPTVRFRFPQPPRSGLRVATLSGVTQAYGDHIVYRDLDFSVERGQRLVLVGPNGAGKSTLLKIVAGLVPIRAGLRELGTNVVAGYFAQNRVENLDPRRTVLEEVMALRDENPDLTEQGARTLLGSFLFRKDDVFKRIAVLSGGEKSRLALAKLLVAPPNLLLMDEPTTHLDMASIETLIAALEHYEGTLLFVSHDVYFIRRVARQVLHVQAGRLTVYAGDYDYYLEKSRATDARAAAEAGFTDGRPPRPEPAAAVAGDPGPADGPGRTGPKTREQRRLEAEQRAAAAAERKRREAEIALLEGEIVALETRQTALTAALEAPETYSDPAKPQALNRELAEVVDRLAACNEAWGKAAEALTAANAGRG
jgi:ATP-binding cassette subfamily F protein 3